MSPPRRPRAGDVFQVPVGDDHVAYGQVLSTEEFVHLVVFDGLNDAEGEHDLNVVLAAPVILYAWTDADLFRDRTWRVVENRPVERSAHPPVEFVRPWDERAADRDDEATRLLRRLRS